MEFNQQINKCKTCGQNYCLECSKHPEWEDYCSKKCAEKTIILGPYFPCHIDFPGEICCGIFNDLKLGEEEGLYCNECGININNAISNITKLKNER